MVRYWYSFTPLVVIPTVILLALPWLGLIALMVFVLVVLVALGALAWGVVVVPRMLVRSMRRRLHSRSGVELVLPPPLAAARPRVGTAQSMPAGALLLAGPPPDSERTP